MTILMIVPTRGRPHNAKELIESWEDTSRVGQSDLLLAIDEDDPKLAEYQALRRPWGVRLTVGPRLRLGGTLNRAATWEAPYYTALGFMGDDHRFRTPEWDLTFNNKLIKLGDFGIVYGNDLLQGAALPTAVVLSSDIVEILGYMAPPGLIHFYLDNFWKDLGSALGTLEYFPEVIIEHMHPGAGKAPSDAGYQEVNTFDTADHASYTEYLAAQFNEDVRRLKDGS